MLLPIPIRVAAIPLVVLCAASAARAREREAPPLDLSPPDELLVDKEVELAAIVKVQRTESRSVMLPDGDPLSLILAECEMVEILSGSRAWTAGTTQTVLQYDYNSLIFDRIAPPVIGGRLYVLWGLRTPMDGVLPAIAPWTAHLQGFLPIRGQGDGEFVFWNGKSYSVGAIRKAVAAGRRVPLDQIVDPVMRLRVAEERVKRGDPGDEKAFIQGLLVNVLDPEGQARRVERAPQGGASVDPFGIGQGEGQPHSLWYRSLSLLRDLGKDPRRRASVVVALAPVAQTARPPIRLAAALALVDLGSDAGRDALIRGFESESGPVSRDPPDGMTFPGHYPHDGSSTTACAHALARLGDRRGLRHPRADVRLATAEALENEKDPELRKVLQDLSAGLQPQVDKPRADGEPAKASPAVDGARRFPEAWVRTQRLLARTGDDDALRRLVEAHIAEAATSPKEGAPVPEGPVSWSSGPSPAEAVRGADGSAGAVLARMTEIFSRDPRWNGPALTDLRASLEKPASQESAAPPRPKPTESQIAGLLADPDPNRRAEGLAAAGRHQVEAFHAKVLDTALAGDGIERQAAIYALGLYGRDVPEPALRRLLASDDIGLRFLAVELATRRDAARFAAETMELVRAVVALAAKAKAGDWTRQSLRYLPRIVCRLARGPIPQSMLDGLSDADPTVRRITVQALELSGNPDAVRSLEPLTRDPDPATREASRVALLYLGPAGD